MRVEWPPEGGTRIQFGSTLGRQRDLVTDIIENLGIIKIIIFAMYICHIHAHISTIICRPRRLIQGHLTGQQSRSVTISVWLMDPRTEMIT